MNQSLKNFRFALWGLLGAFLIYAGYWAYNAILLSGSIFFQTYMIGITYRIAIILSILLVELFVYWLIRRRLYYKTWVLIHVSSIWFAMVIMPAVFLVLFYYRKYRESPVPYGEVPTAVAITLSLAFLISLLVGHLFFTLTIVKSFSKKKKLQMQGATDSPHILDEFNQETSV